MYSKYVCFSFNFVEKLSIKNCADFIHFCATEISISISIMLCAVSEVNGSIFLFSIGLLAAVTHLGDCTTVPFSSSNTRLALETIKSQGRAFGASNSLFYIFSHFIQITHMTDQCSLNPGCRKMTAAYERRTVRGEQSVSGATP